MCNQSLISIVGPIIGGVIAGGVGLLVTQYREKIRQKLMVSHLITELDHNKDILQNITEENESKEIQCLHTTAYSTLQNSGYIAILPISLTNDIFYIYDKISVLLRNESEDVSLLLVAIEDVITMLEKYGVKRKRREGR